MKTEECKHKKYCLTNCSGEIEETECCACYELYEHIDMLIDAINQGTKKFDYEQAPFLHEAMSKHFEFSTGINIDSLLDDDFESEEE